MVQSLWYMGRYLNSSKGIPVHPGNLFHSFAAKMDMLIRSDKVYFPNIHSLKVILFRQLTHFGTLSFFNFRPSFLSPDAFTSIGCIRFKQIFLAVVNEQY